MKILIKELVWRAYRCLQKVLKVKGFVDCWKTCNQGDLCSSGMLCSILVPSSVMLCSILVPSSVMLCSILFHLLLCHAAYCSIFCYVMQHTVPSSVMLCSILVPSSVMLCSILVPSSSGKQSSTE